MKERHKRQREKGHCFDAEFITADCTRVSCYFLNFFIIIFVRTVYYYIPTKDENKQSPIGG